MSKPQKYDLKQRTFSFAKEVRSFIRKLPKDLCNFEDCKQLTKSSGSVGANYIEADESISTKDFTIASAFARKRQKKAHTGWRC